MPKKLLLVLLPMLLAACAGQPLPKPEQPSPPVVVKPEPPKPSEKLNVDQAVAASKCTTYYWKNRGTAKIGYIKGMVKSYARSYCRMNPVMTKGLGSTSADALAHYGLNGSTEKQRLKQLYTLLIGLGMRESSGFYGCGRDMSATNVSHDTAETGLFQFSYNLNSASPELGKLYAEYKANPSQCDLDTFKQGSTKSVDERYAGVGPGLEFQKFTRFCPAFAAEYTAIGARVRRAHWGPINRKEAEYNKDCESLLSTVEAGISCK